jgi:hypothetical protein
MAHDAKGRLLEVGDKVIIPGVVKRISDYLGYCNVEVELAYLMPPEDTKSTISSLNTAQVEKV